VSKEKKKKVEMCETRKGKKYRGWWENVGETRKHRSTSVQIGKNAPDWEEPRRRENREKSFDW
jgi:hypothetical protein